MSAWLLTREGCNYTHLVGVHSTTIRKSSPKPVQIFLGPSSYCLEQQGVLKIKTEDSSRILVDTYHAEWYHIPDDCDLHGESSLFCQFIKLNEVLLHSYFP
jgi:hypothetical protein